jgi:hypothetical protein
VSAQIQTSLLLDAEAFEAVDDPKDSWCTPPEIVDIAHRMWPEGIGLDPCSNRHALALGFVRAAVAWTKSDDCRRQPTWNVTPPRTTCWLQPPYSREGSPIVDNWARRWDAGELWETIALVRVDSSTEWWKQICSRATSLVHFTDRLAHYEAGQRREGSNFCSAMFLMTRAASPKVRHDSLVASVGDLGWVYR